ncbi:MAG: hypothetical protein SFY80_14765 [Verrucomicrobiota bacterium]|nr:hypothetical protein [Verrucomicrobiota bacterium]
MNDNYHDNFATKKKPSYAISPDLRAYLLQFDRERRLPVTYHDLLDWQDTMPLYDSNGNDTLWQTVIYRPDEMPRLNRNLTMLYSILKAEGETSMLEHLYADRIDYCAFGNSKPFRIRIVNARNDNQDYYYIKLADASRVYGLEIEHLLSPNRMHYLTEQNTLVEEHVVGIPGDIFIEKWMHDPHIKKIRLAKELVKFNERCFVRLLGDMRPYNFVVDVTPDFEEVQIRIRSMDFDQQSYSGRKTFYLPQFFKDNLPLVTFCTAQLEPASARQYQREEQSLINRRMMLVRDRLTRLLSAMRLDKLSSPDKVLMLRESLADHYKTDLFLVCQSMGDLVTESLEQIIRNIRSGNSGGSTPLFPLKG